MPNLETLKEAVRKSCPGAVCVRDIYKAAGYRSALGEPNVIVQARVVEALFARHEKYVYPQDRIAGSLRGLYRTDIPAPELEFASQTIRYLGRCDWWTNSDHFAPDFETILSLGISGLIDKIKHYSVVHMKDEKRSDFLEAAAISMNGFRTMVGQYADAAAQSSGNDAAVMEKTCRALTNRAPRSFREALQLVWLIHLSFCCEGRFAMALGRIDQYLRPFYEKDIREGIIDREEAVDLLASAFIKIGERALYGGDDVVNICIGGVLRDGSGGVNDLSFDVLEAVRRCNIPGPNLSARLYAGVPGEFLDACLQVIGTGLGYPALMNDEVNIPALARHSYSLEDSRDYCFVGCIENFIPGRQPPWSDGRFNVPKYVELALNNGRCMLTGVQQGLETGAPETLNSMTAFMTAVEKQIAYGFELYMADFTNYNNKFNRELYRTPYLSCYCRDCIERGLDINGGGALYPSIHGAGCMGIGTVADSLAAVERIVYEEKQLSLADLRDVLKANFEGYEALRARLLNAPKYGNDDDFVDKYAVWYVKYLDEVFSKHHTPDGGPVYTAIASNTSNIPAGLEIAATPDGRKSGEPLSDAASPMHGMDSKGPTAVINSMSKPDYKLVSCGTVLNQKYSPEMFRNPDQRKKLAAIIKVYFDKGGQEIQINSVSRDVLKDAMDNPEKHAGMVVRVSGFSAYYTKLPRSVQEDILKRTEHS